MSNRFSVDVWLAQIPTLLTLTLMVAVVVGPLLVILWQVRRSFDHETMRRHHDVAGFVFAAVGVIYGVVLAYSVVLTYEHHHDAEVATTQEAGHLAGILRILGSVEGASSTDAQTKVGEYARTVLNGETDLGPNLTRSADSRAAIRAAWASLLAVKFAADDDGTREELLDEMAQVQKTRVERLLSAQPAVHGSLWAALLLGGLVTIAFSLLFSIDSYAPHALVVGGLAALIMIVLFVVVQLNYPFIGADAVDMASFEMISDQSPGERLPVQPPVGIDLAQ